MDDVGDEDGRLAEGRDGNGLLAESTNMKSRVGGASERKPRSWTNDEAKKWGSIRS